MRRLHDRSARYTDAARQTFFRTIRHRLLACCAILATASGFLSVMTTSAVHAQDGAKPEPEVLWTFSDGTAGWEAVADVKLLVEDGRLIVKGTGNDPHFTASVQAPGGWKLLKIQARFKGRLDGQLFWSEAGSNGFSEGRSVRFDTRSDGGDKQISVYFHTDNDVTSLRIDPHAGKCNVEIARIELLTEQPPVPQATPVESIRMAEGFHIERLYSVPGEQGSWVNMCVDPRGRLITSDQYGGLYRITPPAPGSGDGLKVEPIAVELGMAQGLCWAFDSLYVVVNGNNSGLYRVRDTNNDDQLDDVQLLRAIRGASEHGPHAVVLSPDGKSLYLCGGNHTDIPDPETSRVPRNWDEDQLLPRMWDAGGHAVGKVAPAGWIAKTDPEGKHFELISIGFRNEYDLAFNADGELFTYDADMEWDVGSPWYRPTRVNHAVSGAEFGWRSGTGKWPDFYPDSVGSVVDIGPGSPTGIVFGYGAKFPAKYQQALFICDWSYGVLYAVHMTPDGATYTGQAERFASGTPLQLTDVVINPVDGAMYFTIGGRRTQSGLYRVTYTGSESTASVDARTTDAVSTSDRLTRHKLEAMHEAGHGDEVDYVWEQLGSDDRSIRYAARIALEHMPVDHWQSRVPTESQPDRLIAGAVALARNGKPEVQQPLVVALAKLDWKSLSELQQLALIRAHGLALIRLGEASEETRAAIIGQLSPHYPTASDNLNRELCRVLVKLNAPDTASRTVELLESSPTQEGQIHYALCLRALRDGWNNELRTRYFEWFLKAAGHRGGNSFAGFLKNIRNEAIEALPETTKQELADLLAKAPNPEEVSIMEPREVVQKWTVSDLLPALQTGKSGRSFENGRRMFAQAACFKCHRFAGQGGIVGPDLTAVSGRFNDLNMLESLIEPSKVISDQYEATTFLLESGKAVTGRIINLAGDNYLVSENMLDPGRLTPVNSKEIEEIIPSKVSMMPAGLLDTLTNEEILDLIAYLRSAGNPNHEAFRK